MILKSNQKEKTLTEGLFQGDLLDVISDEISIDEYKSKILDDDESIVVVFRTENRDAAYDLSSFIERGPFAVLDTEVSDRLADDGMFLLFLEMKRDKKFIKNFLLLMKKINNLAKRKMKDWKFLAYKMAGSRTLSGRELKSNIRIKKFNQLPEIPEEPSLLERSDEIVIRRINY